MTEGNNGRSYGMKLRSERSRPITVLEVEFEGELHGTKSHRQQLELEFHESKVSNQESIARREDLNWRRVCFWYSGQERQGKMKKMMKMDPISRLGLSWPSSILNK